MLSKSKGQVLRIASVLHMLFHIGSEEPVSDEVSNDAITAAVNFVKIAGRVQVLDRIGGYYYAACYVVLQVSTLPTLLGGGLWKKK